MPCTVCTHGWYCGGSGSPELGRWRFRNSRPSSVRQEGCLVQGRCPVGDGCHAASASSSRAERKDVSVFLLSQLPKCLQDDLAFGDTQKQGSRPYSQWLTSPGDKPRVHHLTVSSRLGSGQGIHVPFNFESTWSGALLLGLLAHTCDLSIWEVEAGRPQTKSILAYMASWRPACVIWYLVSEKQKQKISNKISPDW